MIVDPSVLPFFLVSAFLVMIIPGADMVFIIANSVSDGKKAGVVSTFGIASGGFLHFIAAALGITAIFVTSELAYEVVRILGAGYLAWIGFQFLTTKSRVASVQAVKPRQSVQIYRQGVLTNLLNPKAILFNLAFVPQFVSISHGTVWAQMLVLGGILVGVGILTNLLIVVMATHLAAMFSKRQSSFGSYFSKIAGGVLIGFAFYMALSRKPV